MMMNDERSIKENKANLLFFAMDRPPTKHQTRFELYCTPTNVSSTIVVLKKIIARKRPRLDYKFEAPFIPITITSFNWSRLYLGTS
jgi:hypothetical protein